MNASRINDAIAEDKMEFTFHLKVSNWFEKLLVKFKLRSLKKIVYISPITLGSRFRYSKYALQLDVLENGKGLSAERTGLIMSKKHTDNLVMAIAIVIHNCESKPPKWMVREIRNLNQNQLLELIGFVKKSLDTDSFLNSIISLNGMSLQTEEIIAAENESPVSTK